MRKEILKRLLKKKVPFKSECDYELIARSAWRILIEATHKHLRISRRRNILTVEYQLRKVVQIKVIRKKANKLSDTGKNKYVWLVSNYEITIFGKAQNIAKEVQIIHEQLRKQSEQNEKREKELIDFTKRLIGLGLTFEEISDYCHGMEWEVDQIIEKTIKELKYYEI